MAKLQLFARIFYLVLFPAFILLCVTSANVKYKPVGAPIQTIDTQSYTVSFSPVFPTSKPPFFKSQYVLESSTFSGKTIQLATAVCDIKPLDAEHPTPCVVVYESDKAGRWACEQKYYEMYVDNDTYQSIGNYFYAYRHVPANHNI